MGKLNCACIKRLGLSGVGLVQTEFQRRKLPDFLLIRAHCVVPFNPIVEDETHG